MSAVLQEGRSSWGTFPFWEIRDEHGCEENTTADFLVWKQSSWTMCTRWQQSVLHHEGQCKLQATAGTLQKTLPMKGKVISSVGPFLLCKFQRLPWSCFPLISYFMFFKFPQGGKHSSVVNKINVLMKAHGGGVCNWTSCLPSQCTGPSLLTFIPLLLSCKDLLEPVCSLDYPVNITCSFLPVPFSHCSSCLEHN